MDELFILYDDVMDTEQRGHKVIAAAMGADVDWGDGQDQKVFHDLDQGPVTEDNLPFGLGYRTIEEED